MFNGLCRDIKFYVMHVLTKDVHQSRSLMSHVILTFFCVPFIECAIFFTGGGSPSHNGTSRWVISSARHFLNRIS